MKALMPDFPLQPAWGSALVHARGNSVREASALVHPLVFQSTFPDRLRHPLVFRFPFALHRFRHFFLK